MEKVAIIILVASSFLVGLISCSDSEPQEITLIGQWELNEICFSDGASSCNEEEIKSPDFEETITFNADGRFLIIRDGSECKGAFTYDGRQELVMEADNNICNFDSVAFRVFDLAATSVEINPPCREACVKRYVRL